MRTILHVFSISILLFVLNACSEKKTENTTSTSTAPKLNHRPPAKEQADVPVDYTLLDSAVSDNIIKLDSIYGHTPYYVKTEQGYLFYVCAKELTNVYDGEYNSTKQLLGIADGNCNELLKPQYTKIYNPDATALGYIEIESNGKRGLFNYKTHEIISPSFDVIFPSDQPGIDAFGKQGDLYTAIVNGVVTSYNGKIPTYISHWQKWEFNIKNKSIIHLRDSYMTYSPGDPDNGEGIIFTPSYLFDLGFLSEIVTGVDESGKADFATIANEGKLIEEYSITDKIVAFISSFYEEGVDGRGWEINRNSLVTVDDRNNILGKQLILNKGTDQYILRLCSEIPNGYQFLENNVLEVKEVTSSEKEYPLYDYMTKFSYYKIEPDGVIKDLSSENDRYFAFTKYILLNEKHFKGDFLKFKGQAYSNEPDADGSNMWYSEHLSIEDLDLMRNEIYAEYGLIFKSPKWQEYFNKKYWYKGQYENVDAYLSEIDKVNIKFILSIKDKMTGNELKFTKKRGILYQAAG